MQRWPGGKKGNRSRVEDFKEERAGMTFNGKTRSMAIGSLKKQKGYQGSIG